MCCQGSNRTLGAILLLSLLSLLCLGAVVRLSTLNSFGQEAHSTVAESLDSHFGPAASHICDTIVGGDVDGFNLFGERKRLRDLGLQSRKPLLLCPAPGTTATRGLYFTLCKLGVASVHWKRACVAATARKHLCDEGSPLVEGPADIFADIVSAGAFPTEATVNSTLQRIFAFANHTHLSAMIDTPSAELFWDLYHMFPNAKVILTIRDVEQWALQRVAKHSRTLMPSSQPFGLQLTKFSPHQRAYQLLLHYATIACLVPSDRLLLLNYFSESEADIERRIVEFLGLLNASKPALSDKNFNFLKCGAH